MIQDSDLAIIINMVDLHERTMDTDLKAEIKEILTKVFDKIRENTAVSEEEQ